uniref:Lactococcin A secretion protein LcnD n=1 Tax=Latilactobacillus sakei TaxID=1599 RepID=A0A8F1IGE9_LATSK|nr:bacteriocin secretion accessory protein [Latilactobacillus sakei]QWP89830.1 Lactococcin A secretion protein LcnD [Latilactobacillus sakei]UMW90454.1 Lactococcin A secretion protein LcnD [Latilactobacillus sakei]
MDKEFLESSEFYSARFKNFSTLLIMPIAVLLCLVCIFSFFGKREITIEGQGDLTTNKQIPILQASTNSVLKQNYLKEGKFVKKGQTLLVYQNTKNQNQKRLLEKQQDNLSYQITSLETLKASIRSNQDQFENNDQFGYRDLLRGYLDQRQVYLIENQMVTDKAATSTTKQQTLTAIMDKTIQRDQTNLDAYQALYQSIKTNKVYLLLCQ